MGRKQNIFVDAQERKPLDRRLTRPGALGIVLVNPRIPQNTGSVARMCAATGSRLDLINPFFKIDDAKLKRAGLDYWPLLDVRIFNTLEDWLEANDSKVQPWLIETVGSKPYTQATFEPNDFLFFGDEQEGLAPSIIDRWPNRTLRIPQQNVRSMNLAMTVGIVSFEALRQLDFLGME